MGAFPLIHVFAARRDRAGAVTHDHIIVAHAHRLDQRGAGNRRRACAIDHHLHIAKIAPGQVAGIEQARRSDDRGAVLIIMHHRDLHAFAQCGFDDEAFGRFDIFKVDAAKGRLHQRDRIDESFGVFGIEFDIEHVHVGKPLEQHRFAFHHRLGSERAEIAHAENRGAIGNNSDQIAFDRIARGERRIGGDGLNRRSNARRIGKAEIALRGHRFGRDDLQLTWPDRLMIEQCLAGGEATLVLFGHGA